MEKIGDREHSEIRSVAQKIGQSWDFGKNWLKLPHNIKHGQVDQVKPFLCDMQQKSIMPPARSGQSLQ